VTVDTAIDRLSQLIALAENILCFTGAGVSTASSIPDFRGPQGVWRTRAPVYYQDFLASEEARVEYWEFKLEGYAAFRDARPNAAHHALVALDRLGKLGCLVTQNIDGLHAASGAPAEKLVELHGTGRDATCLGCSRREAMAACLERFERTREPPRCSVCSELLKPAVVMFGEGLVAGDFARAHAAARTCDLVLSLGSSLTVTPAADVPLAAARRGVPYVIVNRGATPHDTIADLTIADDVGSVLARALRPLGVELV
jgi:NAD-dependent deacetylase